MAGLFAIGIAACLCIAAVARATPPSFFEFDAQQSGTIDCSTFNPAWTFSDNFTDFFLVQGADYVDAGGSLTREVLHIQQTSDDVNSLTGFTLHEHNDMTATIDFAAGTITVDGTLNNAQRRGVGEVIQRIGHKVLDLQTGDPIKVAGPRRGSDEAFCAAIAP